MAQVQYGGGILDVRGSIGGQVHSRNRYASYIRARTTPVNPQSSRQQDVRAYISSIVDRWREVLTSAQREAWGVYAANISMLNKLGQTIKITGFNHYVRSNAARLQMGLAVVDAGPTELSLPSADTAYAVAASEATQLITVTFDDTADWCSETGAGMSIIQMLPRGEGRNYLVGPTRYCGVILGNSGTPITSPQTVTAAFPFAEGQQCIVQARISRADGRLSAPFLSSFSAAA